MSNKFFTNQNFTVFTSPHTGGAYGEDKKRGEQEPGTATAEAIQASCFN